MRISALAFGVNIDGLEPKPDEPGSQTLTCLFLTACRLRNIRQPTQCALKFWFAEVAVHWSVEVLPVGVHEKLSSIMPAKKAIDTFSFVANIFDRGFGQVIALQECHCTGKARALRQAMHSQSRYVNLWSYIVSVN